MQQIYKKFLDLSFPLKLSGIDVTAHSHLIDTEKKKLMKSDPNKNTTAEKEQATSSASDDLTPMGF